MARTITRQALPRLARHIVGGQEGWELIAEMGEEVTLKRRKFLINADEKLDHTYVILDGMLISQEFQDTGKAITCNIYQRGALIFEGSAILNSEPRETLFWALEKSRLKRISREELEAAIEENGEIGKIIMSSLFDKMNIARDQIRDIHDHDATRRVLSLLDEMVDCRGVEDETGEWKELPLQISQQTMADMLGMNRVTVAKSLKTLKDSGHISKNGGLYRMRIAK